MVGKKLIICEGRDDLGLLNRFLEKLGYQKKDFEIMSMGGKSYLLDRNNSNYIVKRQQIETGQYGKVLFIVDADYSKYDAVAGGHVNTKEKIIELIMQLELKEVADYLGITAMSYREKEKGRVPFNSDEMFMLAELFDKPMAEIFLPRTHQNGDKNIKV